MPSRPPGCAVSRRARSRTAGWSFFLPADPGRVVGSLAGPAAASRSPLWRGAAPDPPPEARDVFGPGLPVAEEYVRLLAGAGVAQWLLGPREVPRLWSRHVLNCAAVAELVPHPAAPHLAPPHLAPPHLATLVDLGHDQRRLHSGVTQCFADVHAAETGHAEVNHDQVGARGHGFLQADLAIGRENRAKPLLLQHYTDYFANAGVIVDDQDGLHASGP